MATYNQGYIIPPRSPSPSKDSDLRGLLSQSVKSSQAAQTAKDAVTKAVDSQNLQPGATGATDTPFITSATPQVDAEPQVETQPQITDYTDPTQVSPLVSEQITGLLTESNPYMKAAETRGKQYAQQRGLLNTSLGSQAATAAAIDAALPIATADATFAQNVALQDDRLAVTIMGSDMPESSKNAALDYLLGLDSSISVPDSTPTEKYGDYKTVRANYSDFPSFIVDSDARNYWKTGSQDGWEKIAKDAGYKKEGWGVGYKRNKSKALAIQDTYGSWDNALKAARTWGGPNLTDNEAKALILSTI